MHDDLKPRLRDEVEAELGPRPPQDLADVLTRGRRKRLGLRLGTTMSVVVVGAALVAGGVSIGRSLSSDEALPPANPDAKGSPFVDTWVTTDDDGSTPTMVVQASGEGAYEIVVRDDLASVCSGAPSTMTGTGRLDGARKLVIPSPAFTCDDGSDPKALTGPPLEEQLRDLTFVHDPDANTLTDNFGQVWRQAGPDADEEDSNVSPFVDTWTTTDVDGRTRTMVIRASGEDAYEITVQNHLAHVCSGAPSTLTGTGQVFDSKLVIPSPEITCDDGSRPKVEDDLPPPQELLRNLTFYYDPESDILTDYSPLERRRDPGGNRGAIYSGLTLVWSRAEAGNRIGDVSGWITYGDKDGIWARDLTSPRDPADRVRLSSTPGSPIAWSRDRSKLLVARDDQGLFVVNSDGSETRLTDANDSINGSSFSPEGTAVVYAVVRADDSSAIHVVDAEGGSPRVLLTSGSRRYPDPDKPGDYKQSQDGDDLFETLVQEPKWSPDGSHIAYFDGMGDWGNSLRVMDSDGSDSRVVVENSETLGLGHVYGLEWSPDGSRLAFSIGGRLYVVGVDGSGFRLVTDNGMGPYWSPDGSHIAYTRPDPETSGSGSLEIVRLDDLQVQNFGDGGSGPWSAEMEWSAGVQ